MVVALAVQSGDTVLPGQKLLVIEAMKMQTTIAAERDAKVADVFVKPGSLVSTGDLMMVLE
jgi:pyruvate carboxylase